ncbi:MAG TPA: hypothetical protein PK765_04775 [bacterium]|nr:hypothetical protein [bacterium]
MPNNTHAIRIISWNLQKGYRKSSLERQLEQVLALGPDFLCLQEVVWNARSIVERLLMKMRGQYRLIQRPVSPLVPKVLAMTGLIVRSDWHDKSAEFVRLENNETRENTK